MSVHALKATVEHVEGTDVSDTRLAQRGLEIIDAEREESVLACGKKHWRVLITCTTFGTSS